MNLSHPRVEEYSHDDAASATFGVSEHPSTDLTHDENTRQTIAQFHRQEIQNLRQNR